jgi:hypothetical protein
LLPVSPIASALVRTVTLVRPVVSEIASRAVNAATLVKSPTSTMASTPLKTATLMRSPVSRTQRTRRAAAEVVHRGVRVSEADADAARAGMKRAYDGRADLSAVLVEGDRAPDHTHAELVADGELSGADKGQGATGASAEVVDLDGVCPGVFETPPTRSSSARLRGS